METKVYVDVLLVLNYVINMLLILCMAKLTGRKPKRRRIVAAALLGSAGSLTIFLPFFGFAVSILWKLLLSMIIVLTAFSYVSFRLYCKQLFVFFAVSFFFAGVMLAVWMAFAPRGMLYYNGVVYFNISSITLLLTTTIAYGLLSIFQRFTRGGRLQTAVYQADITLGGRTVTVQGLVDTGNSLYEPFSDIPVMVCGLADVATLLPQGLAEAILSGRHLSGELPGGLPLRLVPYDNVGGGGAIPAFRPDLLRLVGPGGEFRVETVYIAMTMQKIGGEGYNAILNPDLIGVKILQGGARQ